jgi:hypothetical protein
VAFVSSHGVLNVSHDVVVKKRTENECVVISDRPHFPMEVVTMAVDGKDGRKSETVRILARRLVLVDGVVKHELRLARLGSPAAHATEAASQETSRNR